MDTNFYIKRGKKYINVGLETPNFLSDGIWLVEQEGGKKQRIAKIGELKKPYPYARMAPDRDILASYINIKFEQYISDSIRIRPDGTLQYHFPASADIAKDILLFLSKNLTERRKEIDSIANTIKSFDKEGNVLDYHGRVVHHRYSKEAIYLKIKELEKQIRDAQQMLGERCLDAF